LFAQWRSQVLKEKALMVQLQLKEIGIFIVQQIVGMFRLLAGFVTVLNSVRQ
jgi:hypothetical protein